MADGAPHLVIELTEGERHDLLLELSEHEWDGPPPDPEHVWRGTRDAWSAVVPDCADTVAPGHVARSYAVLCGLTSACP